MKNERHCSVCGTAYEYCHKCKQYETLPRWYSEFCGEECKNIYSITNMFAFNHIAAEDAKREISSLNTDKVINEEIKDLVKTINESVVETINVFNNRKNKKKITEEPVIEEIVNED